MNISEVKTAIKVATVTNDSSNPKKLWNLKWDVTDKTILKDESGRVYLIVVNGEIYKIGASVCKGGIQKTISIYRDYALVGTPSIRTFGIHQLIKQELDSGNNVEFYLIQSQKIDVPIAGLYGIELKRNVSVDCKQIENKCLSEYHTKEGRAPKWNFQENHEVWPKWIAEIVNKQSINQTNKAKKLIKARGLGVK
jgi:hypothetical protein